MLTALRCYVCRCGLFQGILGRKFGSFKLGEQEVYGRCTDAYQQRRQSLYKETQHLIHVFLKAVSCLNGQTGPFHLHFHITLIQPRKTIEQDSDSSCARLLSYCPLAAGRKTYAKAVFSPEPSPLSWQHDLDVMFLLGCMRAIVIGTHNTLLGDRTPYVIMVWP